MSTYRQVRQRPGRSSRWRPHRRQWRDASAARIPLRQLWSLSWPLAAAGAGNRLNLMTDAVVVGYFLGSGISAFVAEDDGLVIGMYKLIPNRIGRGSHVANASFMVDPDAQGRGAGRALGEHCLDEARRQGFDAMQFNFVVSTNEPAVRLWQQLGFKIVGTLPGAFQHPTKGYVDVYVMYRSLL